MKKYELSLFSILEYNLFHMFLLFFSYYQSEDGV